MTDQPSFPLQTAVISVADLATSLAVYETQLGLDIVERRPWRGASFTELWKLAPGSEADVVILADRGFGFGRVMLLDFGAAAGAPIRRLGSGLAAIGLLNLNFYAQNIEVATRSLEQAGCVAWSRPLAHDMGAEVGCPIEVMIDGPDGVILNLLQHGSDPATRSGRMGIYMTEEFGYGRTGLTPVVTSNHTMRDIEAGIGFYRDVLGLEPVVDVVMQGEEMTAFMALQPGSRARTVIVQGHHRFGKIAMTQALNYENVDLVPEAVAPNVGYIAQSFVVDDLSRSMQLAASGGCVVFSGPLETCIPGMGPARTAIVRNPGSGALQWLIEGL